VFTESLGVPHQKIKGISMEKTSSTPTPTLPIAKAVHLACALLIAFLAGSVTAIRDYELESAKFDASRAALSLRLIDSGKIQTLKESLEEDLQLNWQIHNNSENNLIVKLYEHLGMHRGKTATEYALNNIEEYRKQQNSKKQSNPQ
jgi:hypothetical protein